MNARRLLHTVLHASVLVAFPLALSAQEDLDPSFLSAMRARSIGPAGMSGRIAAIDALASDPDVIWVGAATGGVWKSTNGGTTWTPVFDHERVSSIGAVAINPTSPDIVWVGTGEGYPRNSAGVGAGVYRTLDGGRTWTLLGLERSERIHRILLDPTDPEVAWVGVMGPAWSDGEERGVYKTTDGGRSWDRVLFVNPRTGVSDMVRDPHNPNRILAGMWEFRREPWFFTSGGPGSGLYLSDDGGETWRRLSEEDGLPEGTLGRIGLSYAPSARGVAYALVEAKKSALLRSDDGGMTWRTVNDERGVLRRPFYYTGVFVDPANELRLYNLSSRVMISEDGGRSFRRMTSNVHPDVHAMWIDPGATRHMFVGTDGGVYESRDRAATWRMIDNLPVGQFYHVSVDMDIPYHVYGGMQDNGSWRGPSDLWENGGIRNYHWKEVGFGDGFNTLLDPRDPHYGFSMSQGGNLQRFDLRNGERKNIRPWAPDSTELRFNWNAALASDPFEKGTIYLGSQFVHKSPDRGDHWQIISPDLTTNDPEKQKQDRSGGLTRDATGAENHTTIVSIAPSSVEKGVIWVGTDDGNVQYSDAGGGSWVDLTDRIKGVPDGTWVAHIEASRHDAATAYVVFDDHRRGNRETYLYRTENAGKDWKNIGKKTAIDGFLHTVEEDPVTPDLLFAGGELGLWVSLDRGEHWFRWTSGLPTVPVRSLVVHPRDHDLVIGTHGRALYVLDDIRPLRALARDPNLTRDTLHLFEPPVAYLHPTAAVDGYHFAADAMFRGETRSPGALLTYWVGDGLEADSVTVSAEDAAGRTVRTFMGPAARGLNRIAWDLREDVPREAAAGEGGGRGGRFSLRGPDVLPGTYTIRIRAGDHESSREVAVMPDPRVDVPMADRQAKHDAIVKSLGISGRLARVQQVARRVSGALDRVDELLDARPDATARDVRTEARALRAKLREVSDAAGANRYRRSVFGLAGSYDAPTEGQALDLERMEEAVDRLVDAMNAFLRNDVANFRRVLAGADLEVFPPVEPVRR